MIRRMLIAASVVSLVVGVTIAVIWVRSYWFADVIGRSTLDAESLRYTELPRIIVQSGRLIISRTRLDLDRESFPQCVANLRDGPTSIEPGLWHQSRASLPYNFRTPLDRFRVQVARTESVNRPYLGYQLSYEGGERRRRAIWAGRYSESEIRVEFSCGYLVVLCLIAGCPGIKSLARVIRRRCHPGLCRHCGYDLRASTDRCPECGSPITATT
jgi:hypothetical protein